MHIFTNRDLLLGLSHQLCTVQSKLPLFRVLTLLICLGVKEYLEGRHSGGILCGSQALLVHLDEESKNEL